LYATIAPKTGLLGLLGFLLYFFANATLASFVTAYEAFVVPVLSADPATSALVAPGGTIPSSAPFAVLQGVGGLVYMLGLVLLGIAVFRSGVMPRWTGALMAASPIFLLVPVPEAPVLTGLLIELPRGLAVAAMGYALFFRGDKKHKSNREAELG
jgi:multisubunit Na+/H+ antiporter MnhC subunit